MYFYMFILLCVMALGVKNELGDDCDDEWKMIGECWTKIHVCAGWYDWQWQYYGYAAANGTQGPTTPHYDSSEGAGSHAVFLLFQNLPSGSNTCNCGFANDYVVEQCHMNIEECFNVKLNHPYSDIFAYIFVRYT